MKVHLELSSATFTCIDVFVEPSHELVLLPHRTFVVTRQFVYLFSCDNVWAILSYVFEHY